MTKYNLDTLLHFHIIDMLNLRGYKELVKMLHIELMDEQCKNIRDEK